MTLPMQGNNSHMAIKYAVRAGCATTNGCGARELPWRRVMRIRRAILPLIVALGVAGSVASATAAAAATSVPTMHLHGHVYVAPMMHLHG
jgi:hypothetical protein